MTESRNDEEIEKIDLMKIVNKMLKALKRLWLVCVLITVVCTAGYTFMKKRTYVPSYRASATFTVSAASSTDDITTSYSSSFNSSYADTFASTFPYIINNDVMREIIKEDLGTSYVNGTITAATTDKTNLVTINVSSNNPDDALAILESVMENYPQVARYVLGDTVLEVLKKPSVSSTPVNSFAFVNTAAKGMIAGIALSLALLAFAAVLDNTIASRKDIQEKLHLRCVGVLPEVSTARKKAKKGAGTAISTDDERIPSNYKEALRGLRTHVLQSLNEYPEDKVIMVTSTVPGEGKSTVAYNLALSLAHNGSKVILVDGDMRRQSIREMTDPEHVHYGLSEVLQGVLPWFNAIYKHGSHNLRILTGKTDPEAAELLDSADMKEIIKAMKKVADYIVIDTPPSGMLADAHVIANISDCVLYVVKPDLCRAESILYSLETLSNGKTHMLGAVLNGADEASGQYGYGYGHYGHYGYGHYGHYGYGHYGKYGYGYGKEEPEE